MPLRRTTGIVSNTAVSDAAREADVIMTAVALGLAADYIATTKQPLQYDMDPLDAASDPSKQEKFGATVAKMDAAPGIWPGRGSLRRRSAPDSARATGKAR